jgi:hypothetical protein
MLARVVPFLVSVPLALSAASCSDPPPTPPAAGVSMSLSPPSKMYTDTRSCNAGTVGSFTYQIGQPDPGKTIENGKQGVKVDCLVKSDGSFNATISGADENGHKPASFSFTGRIADANQTASNTGQMTQISPDTGPQTSQVMGSPGCTFGPVGTLKKGAILTDVDCPLIGSIDDNSSGCSVHGTIAFEYCKTGDEQN